ncbi:hypothetical protein PTTG_10137, partial [Puccinia triticina 1-1 BBBD Race 1]|uniref:Uncharacterized protein n=1 Tax=Puccinia triticina (isolate 1-1 / race 1 (BBBD)) TaxID=630390 RepID=A0A0C4FA96_PUCT1
MSVLRLLFLLLATLLAAVSAFGQELCAGCNSMVPGAPVGEQVQCLARIMCRQGGVDHGICTAWYYPLVVYHCPRCTIVIREKESVLSPMSPQDPESDPYPAFCRPDPRRSRRFTPNKCPSQAPAQALQSPSSYILSNCPPIINY